MMRTRTLAQAGAAALLLACSAAGAQQVYRCGNTYSQKPCDANAAPAQVYRDTAASPPPGGGGQEQCGRAALKASGQPREGEVALQSVSPAAADTLKVGAETIEVRRHDVTLVQRNAKGDEVDRRTMRCVTSYDGARVLRLY